jgi:hypothetical protein
MLAAVAGTAGAGEIVYKSGQRLAGELTDQALLLSTGGAVMELAPGDIAVLRPDEVQLKDGRVLKGTLVGGRVRARTAYGELAIRLDDLEVYRDRPEVAAAPPGPTAATPAAPAAAAPPGPAAATPAAPAAPTPAPAAATPAPAPSPGIPLPVTATPADANPAPTPSAPAPAAVPGPAPAPGPTVARSGPERVAEGGKAVGQGATGIAQGTGQTVSDTADQIGDGFKAFGLAIWDGMKGFGRAVKEAFTGEEE